MTRGSKTGIGLSLGVALTVCALGMSPQSTSKSTTTVNTAQVADRIVNECGGIQQNELVWITGGIRDSELLENLAIEVRKLGAHPFITLGSERLQRSLFTDVPEKYDSQTPSFDLKIAETADAILSVDYFETEDLLADISSERLIAHTKAHEQVYKTLFNRGVVNVHLGNGLYPTKNRAKKFGITEAELANIFWNGVNVNYRKLQTTGANVRNKLAGGNALTITAPNGTNLTLKITNRPSYVSDGVVSSEDRYEGGPACQAWLPAGEVYLAPVAGSAEGTFVANHFYYEGNYIKNLKMTFKQGKLTTFTADGDISKLQERYNAAPTGKEVFAAVDIGINPNVMVPANSKIVTWMAAGTVSIGVGNNMWAGGENNVPFDLFAHLANATVAVDGKKLVDNGNLMER